MKRFSWLISKYLIQAVLPYFVFSWLLLSVILFVQQASRYSDIFFSVNIPENLIWQLTFALVPNVIAFTCPMAVLVGVIIGLSRMLGDNELVAIRSAGVGNAQMTVPIILLGIGLSFFTFIINLYGVPFAARVVRQIALQTALYKLQSPIEPGVFNSGINGYTIYVKNGDFEKGTWENIFIYNEDKATGEMRLITSRSGRIDSSGEDSELVLENAIVSTTANKNSRLKFVSERIGQFRLAIKTKRGEIVEKLTGNEGTPDELGLQDLARYAEAKDGKERIEAQILWQRRIILSVTPLIFALLGTALVLRLNRGGRGLGILLALIGLIFYYLVTLLGEQLARTNQINVFTASLFPLLTSSLAITYLFAAGKIPLGKTVAGNFRALKNYFSFNFAGAEKSTEFKSRKAVSFRLTKGILDFDIIGNLLKYFLLITVFLSTIYLIFTAFELWKFAGEIDGGIILLGKYLLFLLPFVYLQLAPSALMIATLATFVIKSRQNEIVSWTAAGRSVYRLLMPCFGLMIIIGLLNWGIQESVAPKTNVAQDKLRAQIRGRGIIANKEGKFWVANNRRIYSFEMADTPPSVPRQKVKNLSIYEFSEDETRLQNIYRVPEAVWERDKIKFSENAEKQTLSGDLVDLVKISGGEITENSNPFDNFAEKPSHLNRRQTLEQIRESDSESERRNFAVALEKKYTTLFLPFVITLFTAPFALSLSRKGRVVTVGYAVGLWLLFMGVTVAFEQFGLNGYIAPTFAVWSPLFLFSIIGAILISKVKT